MEKNTQQAVGETVCIGVHIPKELHAQVGVVAEKKKKQTGMRYTLSDIVRIALKEYLDRERA